MSSPLKGKEKGPPLFPHSVSRLHTCRDEASEVSARVLRPRVTGRKVRTTTTTNRTSRDSPPLFGRGNGGNVATRSGVETGQRLCHRGSFCAKSVVEQPNPLRKHGAGADATASVH